jgi:hypothetical protein
MADFYVRYYVGHKGKFGHEFLEFEFRPDGEFSVCTFELAIFPNLFYRPTPLCQQLQLQE